MNTRKISRNSFLKLTAAGLAAAALAACGGSCEGCNGCGNSGGGRVDAIYQPYIDGEVELADLNAAYSESRKLVR